MGIGDLIFRTTGIMTRKTIMRNCSKVGEQISDCVAKNESISSENISEIISNVIGKRASKINVAYDRESIVRTIQENFNVSEAVAKRHARVTRAVSVPKLLGKRTALIVPQNSKSVDNVNLVPHELEHALMQTFKFSSKVKNMFLQLLKKLPEKKFNTEKFGKNLSKINEKGEDLQGRLINELSNLKGQVGIVDMPATTEGLLKQCNCKSIEELRQKIREILYMNNILGTKNDLLNAAILKMLKASIKDESFAYKIGGISERKYNELLGLNLEGKSSKSELVSLLYKEAYKVLSKEQRHALMNSIKSMFGIKINRDFELECLRKQEQYFRELDKGAITRTMTQAKTLKCLSKNLEVAEQVVKNDPNGSIARVIMSGQDKRFESLFQKMKKDVVENV